MLLKRSTIKFVRAFWPMRAMDTVLQLAAAFIIGLIHGKHASVSSLRVFEAAFAIDPEVENTSFIQSGHAKRMKCLPCMRQGSIVPLCYPHRRLHAGTNWGLSSVPGNVVMCMVCLCVLSTVAHLRTFSLNRWA